MESNQPGRSCPSSPPSSPAPHGGSSGQEPGGESRAGSGQMELESSSTNSSAQGGSTSFSSVAYWTRYLTPRRIIPLVFKLVDPVDPLDGLVH